MDSWAAHVDCRNVGMECRSPLVDSRIVDMESCIVAVADGIADKQCRTVILASRFAVLENWLGGMESWHHVVEVWSIIVEGWLIFLENMIYCGKTILQTKFNRLN
ncbi:Hypothetical predicted protein [Pelobates cultripes]|uniref:Uncharacterized protein n=1 Tax=Pelobates cultripes TaxID=61616 RepID=A0AAD1WFI9_PELCU|nr:Hypothetical predicted protein [Pelobates cultripes]